MKTFSRPLIAGTLIASLCIPICYAENTVKDARSSDSKGMLKKEMLGSEQTNSARNARDNDPNAITPESQSEMKIHLDRTASIRSEIVDNKALSTGAKNIKIMTLANGSVVLRGIVETTAERETIESIARKHGGNAEITSFLEVQQQRM